MKTASPLYGFETAPDGILLRWFLLSSEEYFMIRLLLIWLILDREIILLKITLQAPSRLIPAVQKFLKLAKVFSGKMLMKADEIKSMVNSFKLENASLMPAIFTNSNL